MGRHVEGGSKGKGKRRGYGGGRGHGRGTSRLFGIEKYGHDQADEMLKLHDDKVLSDEDATSDDGCAEEDVMAYGGGSLQNWEVDEEEVVENLEHGEASRRRGTTFGWRNQDFHGGEEVGDDTGSDSDEDLVFAEAKRLEEIRAARLAGQSEDLLSSLIGFGKGVDDDAAAERCKAKSLSTTDVVETGAQFEAVFAADAEKGSVVRDLTQLSDSKKRSLMRKEAPELQPLLQDFQKGLASLKTLLPLLSPFILERIPSSGASYLQTQASLLLNTLANLSFYLMIKAEGASIRSHPVVSQLVWLRELHESLAPLTKKIGPRLKRAVRAARKLAQEANIKKTVSSPPVTPRLMVQVEEVLPQRRLSVRERLEQLKINAPAALPQDRVVKSAWPKLSTDDLLKLPSRKGVKVAADEPADLHEADPSLGFLRRGGSLTEQFSSIRQMLGERVARQKTQRGDDNVEAKPRRIRERINNDPDPHFRDKFSIAARRDQPNTLFDGEDELLSRARGAAMKKKEKKSAAQEAKEKERLARQFKPTLEWEGRRRSSRAILINRGLVRQRKSTAGNARVTNRSKYEKMVKRRRGAVQDMREGAADGTKYEGEATGVRTHVKKSLRLS